MYDGKYHSVDSSEMSFKMAGKLGFKAAMAEAVPIMLEPISLIEVIVPADYQGDIMGDLSSRRGQLQGTEAAEGGRQKITALVPTSEIMRYAIDLVQSRRVGAASPPGTITTRNCRLILSTRSPLSPKRTTSPSSGADA